MSETQVKEVGSTSSDTKAKVFHGITGFAALTGIILNIVQSIAATPAKIVTDGTVAAASAHANPADFENPIVRVLNSFSYFTILSNLTVCVVCLLLMKNPHKTGKVFDVFRVFSIVAITITGIVYNAVLRATANPEGIGIVSTNILHVLVPILAIAGWLFFGPRVKFSWRIVGSCVAIGLVWLLFTFIRGGASHWYPYGFLNVDAVGMTKALIACLGILLIAIAFAAGVMKADAKLPGEKPWLADGDTGSAEEARPTA